MSALSARHWDLGQPASLNFSSLAGNVRCQFRQEAVYVHQAGPIPGLCSPGVWTSTLRPLPPSLLWQQVRSLLEVLGKLKCYIPDSNNYYFTPCLKKKRKKEEFLFFLVLSISGKSLGLPWLRQPLTLLYDTFIIPNIFLFCQTILSNLLLFY